MITNAIKQNSSGLLIFITKNDRRTTTKKIKSEAETIGERPQPTSNKQADRRLPEARALLLVPLFFVFLMTVLLMAGFHYFTFAPHSLPACSARFR